MAQSSHLKQINFDASFFVEYPTSFCKVFFVYFVLKKENNK